MKFSQKRRLVKIRQALRLIKKNLRKFVFYFLLGLILFALLLFFLFSFKASNKTITPARQENIAESFGTQTPKDQSEWIRIHFRVKVSPKELTQVQQ